MFSTSTPISFLLTELLFVCVFWSKLHSLYGDGMYMLVQEPYCVIVSSPSNTCHFDVCTN